MRREFNIETLRHYAGGQIAEAFDSHCKRVVDDCYDRPGDKL